MQDFLYNEFRARAQDITKRCRQLLGDDVSQQNSIDTDESLQPLKLAFVGQYNAGKSSLVKMLTGIEDIRIGSNVTTSDVAEYDYRGLRIVDTPGIRAGYCASHDSKTLKAIDDADLLVFVITNELFDDILGADFRSFCFDLQRKKQLLLVINKFQNDPGDEQTKLAAICPVLEPLIPEDFPIVFTDAQSYFDAQDEDEDSERKELLELSNRQGLISTIDRFAETQGVYARIITPLQSLRTRLQDQLDTLSSASPGEKNGVTVLRQVHRVFVDNRREAHRAMMALLDDMKGKIIEQGSLLADSVGADDIAEFERLRAEVDQKSRGIVEGTVRALDDILIRQRQDLEASMQGLAQTPWVEKVLQALGQGSGFATADMKAPNIGEPASVFRINPDMAKTAGAVLEKGAGTVVKMAVGDASKAGLKAVSGSKLHEIVKVGGKFLRHNFKPWEAAKLAGKIAKGATWFGRSMVLVAPGVQIFDDIQQGRELEKIKRHKRDIRRHFLEYAQTVYDQFKIQQNECLSECYDTHMREIDQALESVQQEDRQNNELCRRMADMLNEITQLHKELLDITPI